MQDPVNKKDYEFSVYAADFHRLSNKTHKHPSNTKFEHCTKTGQSPDYCQEFFFKRSRCDNGKGHALTKKIRTLKQLSIWFFN